jgi:hypothetical protein
MLKEIFVIKGGILLFHYSSEKKDSESDQAILSSGLLTAMQDFSTHTRSDELESFSTENEYFVFTPDPEAMRVIVGVFSRLARRSLAEEVLTRVKELMSTIKMPEDDGRQLDFGTKELLREEIEKIASQIFGTKQLASYVNELLSSRTDIPLAFVIDSDEKRVVAQFARPKPLFKESYVSEFLLVHSTILKTLTTLGLGDAYGFLTLKSEEYVIAVCWSGKLLSIASGAMRTPEESVVIASANMCYHSERDSIVTVPQNVTESSVARIASDGNLTHEAGMKLTPMTAISVSTLVNNLSQFFKLLNRREFTFFEVVTNTEPICRLSLTRLDNNQIRVSIDKYS